MSNPEQKLPELPKLPEVPADPPPEPEVFKAPIVEEEILIPRFIDSFETFSEAIKNARARFRAAKATLADLNTDRAVLNQEFMNAEAEVAEADTDSLQAEQALFAILGKSIASRNAD